MNTEQLKTAHMMLQEAKEDLDNVCLATKYVLEDDVILNLMDQFASQESKIAVEKDRESRWISVKDRLPEVPEGDDFVRVLLYANGHVLFGKYGQMEDEQGYDFIEIDASQGSMDYCGHATHWQLPEPPKL